MHAVGVRTGLHAPQRRSVSHSLALPALHHRDDSLTPGPQSMRIHGSLYHLIGALRPEPDQQAHFAQLYVYDGEEQLNQRMQAFGTQTGLDRNIVQRLGEEMAAHNLFVGVLRQAASLGEVADLHLRIHADPGVHGLLFQSASLSRLLPASGKAHFCWPSPEALSHKGSSCASAPSCFTRRPPPATLDRRRYNEPTAAEVAAIMPGDGSENTGFCDIVVRLRGGRGLHRIYEGHRAYMPLHFPLLFPRGTLGWSARAFQKTVAPCLSRSTAEQRRRTAPAAAERRAPPPASPLPPVVLPGAAGAAAAAAPSSAAAPQPAAATSPAPPADTSAPPPPAAASAGPTGGGGTAGAARAPRDASARPARASRSKRDVERVEGILADGAGGGDSSAAARPACRPGSRGPNANVTALQHAAYYIYYGERSSMHLHQGRRLTQVPALDEKYVVCKKTSDTLFFPYCA